jgi:hypothetical protein
MGFVSLRLWLSRSQAMKQTKNLWRESTQGGRKKEYGRVTYTKAGRPAIRPALFFLFAVPCLFSMSVQNTKKDTTRPILEWQTQKSLECESCSHEPRAAMSRTTASLLPKHLPKCSPRFSLIQPRVKGRWGFTLQRRHGPPAMLLASKFAALFGGSLPSPASPAAPGRETTPGRVCAREGRPTETSKSGADPAREKKEGSVKCVSIKRKAQKV